jgi:hypothetical protein
VLFVLVYADAAASSGQVVLSLSMVIGVVHTVNMAVSHSLAPAHWLAVPSASVLCAAMDISALAC